MIIVKWKRMHLVLSLLRQILLGEVSLIIMMDFPVIFFLFSYSFYRVSGYCICRYGQFLLGCFCKIGDQSGLEKTVYRVGALFLIRGKQESYNAWFPV